MANTGNIKYSGNSRGGLDPEAHLWPAADKMRGPMGASESNHVCLGLSFLADLHPDLKANFILANPRFQMRDWGGENRRQEMRWKFRMPPVNHAGQNATWGTDCMQCQIHNFRRTRDLLLPRLLSGQVKLRNEETAL